MNKRNEELDQYLHSNSTYLTGREEGKDVRKRLDLDKLDDLKEKEVTFFISDKITGINISFFLGLFSKSIKKLKEKEFRKKYKFEYSDEETQDLVEEDIEYGINEALDDRTLNEILFGEEGK